MTRASAAPPQQLTGPQHPARPHQCQPGAQGQEQQGDEQLVVGTEPDHDADAVPPGRLVPQQRAHAEEDDGRPDHQVRGRREHDVPEQERHGGEGVGPGAQALGRPPTPELARHQSEDQHRCRGRDRRRDPHRPRRVGDERADEADDQRRQGRLVEVAPRRGEQPEVQLVPVVAVTAAAEREHEGQRRHGSEHRSAGQRWQPVHSLVRASIPPRHVPPRRQRTTPVPPTGAEVLRCGRPGGR